MTGPLAGLRVLELAGKGPSQFGAMVLADLGADVIRVDRPGDMSRPLSNYDPRLDLLNRGRRSITLDLRNDADLATYRRLAATVDAVIDPYRPGVTTRLGIGPDSLLARSSALVYIQMTGWGSTGPRASAAGHDINFLAANGVLDMIGRAKGGPVPPLNLVGDFGAGGMMCVVAVLSGVMAARTNGTGQIVDVSMLEASALLATVVHTLRAMGEWGPRGTNLLDTGAPFYDVYPTADGRHLSVGAMERPFYLEFLLVLGLAEDADVVAAHQDRSRWTVAKERIAGRLGERSCADWMADFDGKDVCVEPVVDLEEAFDHPQVVERQVYQRIFDVIQPAPAPRFSRTPGGVDRPPPRPGEHTAEILDELRALLGTEPAPTGQDRPISTA